MATKTERVEMRLNPEHKELLERAAALSGQTVSAFGVPLLIEKARETLERHKTTTLSQADAARFLEILDSDEQPAPALKAAADRLKAKRA